MPTPKESNFPVHGDTPEKRREKIEAVFDVSPMAGFLLSIVNFEWTLRRAILALGWDSTKNIRAEFKKGHGLKEYKIHWTTYVVKNAPKPRPYLSMAIESYSKRKGKNFRVLWTDVRKAYIARHSIIHGCRCTGGDAYLKNHAEQCLRASEALVEFVKDNEGNVFNTIRRTKPRHD